MSRIGELLLREKKVSPQQLAQAQEEAKRTGKRLGVALTKLGYLKDQELTQIVAQQYSLPAINLAEIDIDPAILKLIPKEICAKHQVIPVQRKGATLIVAMADPANIYAIDELKFLTQYNIEPVVASDQQIEDAMSRYYDKGPDLDAMIGEFDVDNVDFAATGDDTVNVVDLENQAGEAPVVKLCNAVLLSAIKKRASDIHVEPYEKTFRVRFRIDGILQEEMRPPLKLRNAIISRLKIMASLDIAERRLPQDGRIKLKIGANREMDFRVSVLPTLFGEKVVIRILDPSSAKLGIEALGYEKVEKERLLQAIGRPYGMILVTGPTGSGKTVSLYTCLNILNEPGVNIATVEDPAEINLPGINQVNVNDKAGLTFAAALKSFLRQDPDIIMVGEIRDLETADIAIKAAQTGHLVMSTLHTNDAPTTLTRMLNMGVAPFNIASSVLLITAQRLARRLCEGCKKPADYPRESLLRAGFRPEELDGNWKPYRAVGCAACNNGYKGRVGLYQVMPITEAIQRIILAEGTALDIAEQAQKDGVRDLRQAGLVKVRAGVTTLEEVITVTNE